MKPQNILIGANGTVKLCDFGEKQLLVGSSYKYRGDQDIVPVGA
jgi:serine/threonine protein kinase